MDWQPVHMACACLMAEVHSSWFPGRPCRPLPSSMAAQLCLLTISTFTPSPTKNGSQDLHSLLLYLVIFCISKKHIKK